MADAKEKAKTARLLHLLKTYPNDFKPLMDEYRKYCKDAGSEPKDLLGSVVYYKKVETLTVSAIQDRIKEELMKFPEYEKSQKKRKAEEQAEKQKERKKKKKGKSCEKCTSEEVLELDSKACDNNYYTLPSGKEGEGYMPHFPALSMAGGDGISIAICVDCGWVQGFDSEALKEAIEEVENSQDN